MHLLEYDCCLFSLTVTLLCGSWEAGARTHPQPQYALGLNYLIAELSALVSQMIAQSADWTEDNTAKIWCLYRFEFARSTL